MPQKISEYLGINKMKLERLGIFDAIIGVDTRLFFDPRLLKSTRISEFRNSRKRIEGYYQGIIRLLLASRIEGDRAWLAAAKRLIFRETKGVSIGYGLSTGDGSAIGPVLGARLLKSAKEILDLGIRDSEIFELIGLFEEDFGADRLSDMTMAIIRQDVLLYSEKMTRKLNIHSTINVSHEGRDYLLTKFPSDDKPLIFLPKSLLRDLPVALSRDGIAYVVAVNEDLRNELNRMIGFSLKKIRKRELRDVVFKDAQNIRALIQHYKSTKPTAYDFESDPAGEFHWYDDGRVYAAHYPLSISNQHPKNLAELGEVVNMILSQFKRNIEVNGANELLWVGQRWKAKHRKERYSQFLFYSLADSYCEANNIDISREPNAGGGPVDFKLSQGYRGRILVEIKLSSNTSLVHGYEKQLPTYQQSERSPKGVYVILRVTNSDRQIKEVQNIRKVAIQQGKSAPDILIIDARLKASASKR